MTAAVDQRQTVEFLLLSFGTSMNVVQWTTLDLALSQKRWRQSKNSLRSLVEHESIRKGWPVVSIGSVIRIRCKANSYTKLPATQWRVNKLQAVIT